MAEDDGDKRFDKELFNTIFPYLKAVLIMMLVCQGVLVVANIKYPRLSHTYFLYVTVYVAI